MMTIRFFSRLGTFVGVREKIPFLFVTVLWSSQEDIPGSPETFSTAQLLTPTPRIDKFLEPYRLTPSIVLHFEE
jgi:hypothetical protein